MTIDEKLDIAMKSAAMSEAGDEEGATRLLRTIPLPPYLAKIIKEKIGTEFFTRYNWNLSEVEAEFGPDFINK
jgi:hypothetical protein